MRARQAPLRAELYMPLAVSVLLLGFVCGIGYARASDAHQHGSGAPSPSYRHCRDVVIRNSDGSIYTQTVGLARRSATCALARRVARRVMAHDGEGIASPLGFTCLRAADGFRCSRGAQRVKWRF
jgi:hypothetical protein